MRKNSFLLIIFSILVSFYVSADIDLLEQRIEEYEQALEMYENIFTTYTQDPWESELEFEKRKEESALKSEAGVNLKLKKEALFDSKYKINSENISIEFGSFDNVDKSWEVSIESKDPAFPYKDNFNYSIKSAEDLREAYLSTQKKIEENGFSAEILYKVYASDIPGQYEFGGLNGIELVFKEEGYESISFKGLTPLYKFTKGNRLNFEKDNIIKLVMVPEGKFQNGEIIEKEEVDENEESDEIDDKIVAIDKAFYLGIYPITREVYGSIMGKDPGSGWYSMGKTDPAHNVSWYNAIAFCNKLSIIEGFDPVYSIEGIDLNNLNHEESSKIKKRLGRSDLQLGC